jgi:hypothetical protein
MRSLPAVARHEQLRAGSPAQNPAVALPFFREQSDHAPSRQDVSR